MKLRVLGCSGTIAKQCRTTSFLVDSDLLIDAGTGVGDLTLEEMAAIDHVFLSHSHLDHILSLPLMVDAIAARRTVPLQVHALQETINALRTHIFNWVIWPDFSVIPSAQNPFLTFHPFAVGETIQIGKKRVEVLPAVHSVPAVGFAVAGDAKSKYWVFTGDTERNPALWQRINQLPVAMLVIETSFSNKESALAQRSLHLSPDTVTSELQCIAPECNYPIYITHTKPAETACIMEEVKAFESAFQAAGLEFGADCLRKIYLLQAGQEFVF